ATRPLTVLAQANQGTVGIQPANPGTLALFAGSPPEKIDAPSRIITNVTDTALLQIFPPESELLLARVQVYGNTNTRIARAESPRFRFNSSEPILVIELDSGRLRLSRPDTDGEPFTIEIVTPQAQLTVRQPGQYSLAVSNTETQVAVQQGAVTVTAGGRSLALTGDQRAVVPVAGTAVGPLDSERNLIVNGDFDDELAEWTSLAWNVELAGQPAGETSIVEEAGDPSLRFSRLGSGHADASVRQLINQDVTDYSVLRLEVSLLVIAQSLGVCGVQGSECPLIVRLEYEDSNGGAQVWQQGFFATGEFATTTPDVCISCPPPRPTHHRVTLGQLSFFTSDILAELRQQGLPPPRRIKSVTLLASGHSFETEVVEVALMAKE
ncbi:MAG: hypothetical protein AB1791_18685, partial [Chloroflexota bacterium]